MRSIRSAGRDDFIVEGELIRRIRKEAKRLSSEVNAYLNSRGDGDMERVRELMGSVAGYSKLLINSVQGLPEAPRPSAPRIEDSAL